MFAAVEAEVLRRGVHFDAHSLASVMWALAAAEQGTPATYDALADEVRKIEAESAVL